VGYYVYRGLVGAGPFLKLNPARETSTSFMDVGVSGGQTYYYVVTAVDTGQVESAFSNQVAVTIPQP
jgi:fibronectin type 3 domain-containing protein